MSIQHAIEARQIAICNMIYFRNDTALYIFWRNVYKRCRAEVWKAQGIFQTKGDEQP